MNSTDSKNGNSMNVNKQSNDIINLIKPVLRAENTKEYLLKFLEKFFGSQTF